MIYRYVRVDADGVEQDYELVWTPDGSDTWK